MAPQLNLSLGDQSTRLSEDEYHRDIAILMVPGMVILGLMMLIGLFDNILVLYVYTFRLKRSTINLFITTLAVSDIVVCLVCIPIEIVVIRYLYSFDKPWLCKILRTIVHFCVFCSISVLVAIAADRYKRICTPFTVQISLKTAKIAIIIDCMLSGVLSIPSMIILGSTTVNTTFTGHACATDDSMIPTPYPGVYNGMQFMVIGSAAVTVSVLYSLILRRIKVQERYRRIQNQMKKKQSRIKTWFQNESYGKRDDSNTTSSQTTDPNSTVIEGHVTTSPRSGKMSTPMDGESDIEDHNTTSARSGNITTAADGETMVDGHITTSPCSDNITTAIEDETMVEGSITTLQHTSNDTGNKKPNSQQKRSHKTTFMMFLVTAVFVVSFIPHLGLMVTRAVQKHTFEHLEGATLALYNIFLRTYFINSVSNPIIYSFLSDKFRREVAVLFRRSAQQPADV